MNALSLWEPWCTLIVRGPEVLGRQAKRIENRHWAPPSSVIGKRIALHAAKTFDESTALSVAERFPDLVPLIKAARKTGGFILGTAEIHGYRQHSDFSGTEWDGQEIWWMGPYAWLLRDVVAIEPVECRGAQRLWRVPLSIEAEVRRREAEKRGAA